LYAPVLYSVLIDVTMASDSSKGPWATCTYPVSTSAAQRPLCCR